MSRINTNIPSIIAQTNLNRANADLNVRLQRLSTGLRINSGADDPAGLIVSERLRSEIQGIDRAIGNSERASSVIATTEAYLTEVADLLNSIRGLVVEAANTGGLSDEEIEANQLQVDSAIESITRISNTASFAGLNLLDGSLNYVNSGIATSALAGVNVYGAQFGNNDTIPIEIEVVQSAQTASLFLSGAIGGGTPGELLSSVTLEIVGNNGVQTVSFISGTSLDDVATAINRVTATTGVSASLLNSADPTSGLTFDSITYGSDSFVSVRAIGESGDFFETREARGGIVVQRDEGRDVTAIINGALAVGDGLNVSLNSPALSVDLKLTEDLATRTSASTQFTVTGGGSTFQLGPTITASQQVGIGVRSIAASRIGGTTLDGSQFFLDSIKQGQPNSLTSGNTEEAARILDTAITEVSQLRGRLGAFERNTLQTNTRSLQIGFENISASESKIRDADFARETAELTRAQVLVQAGGTVLATANSISQNVLQLLG
ncbi:MAG: flagellin [Phycisphaerales bacterium]